MDADTGPAMTVAVEHGDTSVMLISARVSSSEEWEKLCATLNAVATTLWPGEEPEPEAKPRSKRAPPQGVPDEGTFDRQVYDIALRDGADAVAIADALDKATSIVSMSLARLRSRGCL